jgi:hypothetical protein
MIDDDSLEEDLVKFAAKHYYSPKGHIDPEEFYDDLKRFKYVKRLVNRYIETGRLTDRLLMNHIIIIFNVFGVYASLRIFGLKFNETHWSVIKPFLLYLNYISPNQMTDIKEDNKVMKILEEI